VIKRVRQETGKNIDEGKGVGAASRREEADHKPNPPLHCGHERRAKGTGNDKG